MPDSIEVGWISAARSGRHAIQQFSDGAVLIDLDSGDILRLNAAGAFIYQRVAENVATNDIPALLALAFGIPLAQAQSDTSAFVRQAPVPIPGTTASPSPFKYVPTGDRNGDQNIVFLSEIPLLGVHPEGQEISLLGDPEDPHVRAALLWVVPKILVLQGRHVLHASAVSANGRGLAFSGYSGAGKTTLARAFAEAGAHLFAEDSVLVELEGGARLLPLEERALVWVEQSLTQARIGGGQNLRADIFPNGNHEKFLPLTEVLFLDANRREGDILLKVRMGRTEAAAALLQNSFWGSCGPAVYDRSIRTAALLCQQIPASNAIVPRGTGGLVRAARAYIENVAS